ncbi:hypothetical protein LOD99_14370 [Oopsacas minuta]|uniref:Uncharacterized protein n=1 Tax=Oopsacas minuta TaxID=111878 RepID=A0AAV7KFZ2_9METZ|nr:hypothetical protein LOD99_14370 [Oopsacas minuta]
MERVSPLEKIRKNTFIDVVFDCYRLNDGNVHRAKIRIGGENCHPSIEYLQDLIEKELNIPRVCQIDIYIGNIKLNCSPSGSVIESLPRNIFRRRKPIRVTLRYYTVCTSFSSLIQLLDEFCLAVQNLEYREIHFVLEEIFSYFNEMSKYGALEPTGDCIFLSNVGFIDMLLLLIQHIHELLLSKISTETIRNSDPDNSNPDLFLHNQKQTFQYKKIEMPCLCLGMSQGLLWNFGSDVEYRILLYKKGFLHLSLTTLEIAEWFRKSGNLKFVNLGDLLFSQTFCAFGGLSEIWTIVGELCSNRNFLKVLKDTLLTHPNQEYEDEIPIASYMFITLSSHCEISRIFLSDGLYSEVIQYYHEVQTLNDYGDKCYCVSLGLVNMLNTPGTWNIDPILPGQILQIWENFLDLFSHDIASMFEKDYSFNSLEPFTLLYFSPKNSYLGFQQLSTNSVSNRRFIETYIKLALFSLEVVLMLEGNLDLLLKQNIFTHLLIADWKIGKIAKKLRKYYPNLIHFPVPSLYDISGMTAIREGLGSYSEFFHS